MIKILIADDDKNTVKVLVSELSDEGYDVSETDSGIKALDLLEKEEFDILILDLNMPVLDGMGVLRKMRVFDMPPPQVIILTGDATVTTAVEAMKLGAYDYLVKPFRLAELNAVIEKAYEKKKLLGENLLLRAQIKRQSAQNDIITKSPLMLEILGNLKKVAESDFPVLIHGESGTGKELIALKIHEASPRSEGPFIPINCGAIPGNMIESELFGHEKGSFTGAFARKPGLLEISNNGTLFLDEISELPLQLQVKLLRILETRKFFRVGGVKEVAVEVKFVCSTNKDLKIESEKGNFRPDLYYRISALTIIIPPLKKRREDIPLLVEHFTRSNPAFRNKRFGREALSAISEYSWPGNVRELQNVVHRALLLSKNELIERNDLPCDLIGDRAVTGRRLEDVEKSHILNILEEVNGHKARAAEILGINPKTLYRKLAGYEIKG